MSDKIVSTETLIYGSFVKHDRLKTIVYDAFSNTSTAGATELNIFIDMYSVLKSIFSESFRTDISDYTAITSGIINMCSHYRSFFKTLSVHTKFYLFFSFNTGDFYRKFNDDYNKVFKEKSEIPQFRDMAMTNFELLDILCPYLPDIFFIRSVQNYESTVMMANMLERLGSQTPTMIISRDLYPIQLCSYYPKVSFLYPRKTRYGDKSVLLPISEKPSFREEFWKLIARNRNISFRSLMDISPINFPLFSSMYKFPERCIRGYTDLRNTVNAIKKIAGSEDIMILPEQLDQDPYLRDHLNTYMIGVNWKILDYHYMKPYYDNDPECKSIRLENLQDNTAIQHINAKFFAKNPIELQKL